MFRKFTPFKYVYLLAVIFILTSSVFFIIAGIVRSIEGYHQYIKMGFLDKDEIYPGLHLLDGLDFFMLSLVFMIFGLGVARLFVFDKSDGKGLPQWLNVKNLGELKLLLWKTILMTLVIFTVTYILKHPIDSWNALILPSVILILSAALFLVHKTD